VREDGTAINPAVDSVSVGERIGVRIFVEDLKAFPDYDYTLNYSIVPAVAYGRKNTGDYGSRFGVVDPIGEYKKHIENKVLKNLGYEIIKSLENSMLGLIFFNFS